MRAGQPILVGTPTGLHPLHSVQLVHTHRFLRVSQGKYPIRVNLNEFFDYSYNFLIKLATMNFILQCLPNVLGRDCPICLCGLNDGSDACVLLQCGHALHQRCYCTMVVSGNYRCPLCFVSTLQMQSYWDYMDEQRAQYPELPESLGRFIDIYCFDCQTVSKSIFLI